MVLNLLSFPWTIDYNKYLLICDGRYKVLINNYVINIQKQFLQLNL